MRHRHLAILIAAILLGSAASVRADAANAAFWSTVVGDGDAGLCLVIGETDGTVTAALAKGSQLYVQGCTRDASAVAPARQALVAAGVANRASVVLREADYLPYADNLVNRVVCRDWTAAGLTLTELLRVMTPRGVAVVGDAAGLAGDLTKAGIKVDADLSDAGVVRFVKPANPAFGTWTQIKGGADQSYVNDDRAVQQWAEIRWIGAPRWGSLYLSYGGLVTAGGRVYYEESRQAPGGQQWWLVARDAYNGAELWRVPSGPVFTKTYNHTDYTLACDTERVYLVEGKALVARDGRTGKRVNDYAPGFTPASVTSCGNVLLTSARQTCAALDKATGKALWKRQTAGHPAAADGHAWVAAGGKLEAVELATGKQVWQMPVEGLPEKLPQTLEVTVMHKGGVVFVVAEQRWKPDGQVAAFDAATGKPLWHRDGKFSHGVLPFGEEVWCLSRDPKNREQSMAVTVLDARTGKVAREFRVDGNVMAKCWRARGTATCILYSNGWALSRSSGEGVSNPATRSPCRLGQHPANGLTYYMPHHCDCKVTLRGFLALSPPGARDWFSGDDKELGNPRLFAAADAKPSGKETPDDWPTYRGDMRRSNATATVPPAKLRKLWSESPGAGPLTQATSAYGTVYVAEPDARRVFALDAKTGAERWAFVADGRVNHPPTLAGGRCLFGTGAGSVYCLDARTGREIWRLRAAPVQKFIGVESQFDSPWPVAGSVLVLDGVAYFSTGRSASQQSGLWLFAVEAASGKIKWRMRGQGSGDMFVSDGKLLRHAGHFYRPADGEEVGGAKELPGILHCTRYLTAVSVVDYMSTVEPALSYKKHIELTDGRIRGDCIAFNAETSVAGWRYTPGTPGWKDKDKTNRFFLHAAGASTWNVPDIAQHVMGIVVAGERAYVVGRPTSYSPADKSELWVVSLADGSKQQSLPLEGVPVYDGLSAAGGRVYLATEDGRLTCFGP